VGHERHGLAGVRRRQREDGARRAVVERAEALTDVPARRQLRVDVARLQAANSRGNRSSISLYNKPSKPPYPRSRNDGSMASARPRRSATACAVWRARRKSLATMTSMGASASAPASSAAWRSPSSFSGMSRWPCRRRSAFHAVSPWRIRRMSVGAADAFVVVMRMRRPAPRSDR
jgi:hypothetical protein